MKFIKSKDKVGIKLTSTGKYENSFSYSYNEDDYHNVLDKINLTSKEIEKEVKDFPFESPSIRVKKIEWDRKFPMFSYVFYEYILVRFKVPSQEELWDFYFSNHKSKLESKLSDEREKKGLRARIFRTVPSLIRDLHFAIRLKEEDVFDKVVLDPVLDVEEGIDIIIENNDEVFGLELYIDTRRANKARIKKEKRHIKDETINYIELPLKLDEGDRKGDYILYTDNHLKEIKDLILSRLNNY